MKKWVYICAPIRHHTSPEVNLRQFLAFVIYGPQEASAWGLGDNHKSTVHKIHNLILNFLRVRVYLLYQWVRGCWRGQTPAGHSHSPVSSYHRPLRRKNCLIITLTSSSVSALSTSDLFLRVQLQLLYRTS